MEALFLNLEAPFLNLETPFFRLIPNSLYPLPNSKTTLPNSISARIFLFFSKYLLLLQFVMGTDSELFAIRLKKLIESQPIMSNGMECEGLYELNNKSAEKYLRDNFRGNYINEDTGDLIRITRKGAEKVTRHDAENTAHLKSLALIPELIRKSVFIAEEVNEKDKNEYDSFRYYVAGLKMAGIDYTVKLAIGVKNGYTYYDHALTPIEKQKLLRSIDEIKRPFASKEISSGGEQVSDVLSECKDKRLISILQTK